MNKNDEKFMRLAIEKASQGVRKGQTPFGACIVKDRKVIACSHNLVWRNTDITAHAEITAIRLACKRLKKVDLSGCIIYSTCEPCPMCFAACHWAKISRIVFGCAIKDAERYGFNELRVSNLKLKQLAKNKIKLNPAVLVKENIELFELWKKQAKPKVY
ncbi:MAG: nucleoside deaminase [Candidatus Omnitrophica bacterium]|jgi:tRNA(Arg) A34 adenosine deaminase TadA|nr:nucleoside deaminase [Candidatus Omnitrophota bacterium]